jgi:hypothetical protein
VPPLKCHCRIRRYSRQLDVIHVNGFITWATSDVTAAHFVHSTWLRSPVHTARLRRQPRYVFWTIDEMYLSY